jgi:large subunit ribosomal protein L30
MASLLITLTRSPIGCPEKQKRTARALGLKKLQQTVEQPDNDQIRGMVRAIEHLVTVQSSEEAV